MTTWSMEDVVCDGVSLKNYGYGMSVIGGLDGTAPMAGENLAVAYRRGRRHVDKRIDEVSKTLTMWLDCRHPDGTYPSTKADRIRQRNANVRDVLALFGNETRVSLSRTMMLPTSHGGDQTWTATAEAVNPVTPEWQPDSAEEAFFTVDLLFADPLWYGPETSASVSLGGGGTLVDNPGSLPVVDLTARFYGILANPQLTNGSVWLRVGSAIADEDDILVDTARATAKRASDGANLIGAVTNSGARSFMRLARGPNTLTLSADSGSGLAVITYRPVYL